MPIFNPNTKTPSATREGTISVSDKAYKSSTVNSKITKLGSLITTLEGYPWTVTYYHQILGKDDQGRPLDLELPPTLQQYKRINTFELKVTDPLTYEYKQETGESFLKGSANIYPNTIVPHLGDMFIAHTPDGKESLFNVISINPLSYFNEKVYTIEYVLYDELESRYINDINSKVVDLNFFVKTKQIEGKSPLLTLSDYNFKLVLEKQYSELIEMYAQEFIDSKINYLILPDQEKYTFDPYLSHTLMDILNISDNPILRKANWPRITSVSNLRLTTIWDLLVQKEDISEYALKSRMTSKFNIVGIKDTLKFKNVNLSSIHYSSISRILWPLNESQNIMKYSLLAGTDRYSNATNNVDDIPDIYPITFDDYYVFSRHFYEYDPNVQDPSIVRSKLELLVSTYLSKEAININDLVNLCNASYSWGSLERYYYIPVLIIIIPQVIGAM